MRFLWQRHGLLCLHRTTSVPTISSTSTCRLQPIYYSRVSATIRLSKILVHTPSLAPLPQSRDPGHRFSLHVLFCSDLVYAAAYLSYPEALTLHSLLPLQLLLIPLTLLPHPVLIMLFSFSKLLSAALFPHSAHALP